MKAIIPVAGAGTRLRPFTSTIPKPLLPVAGKPILGHIIDNLIDDGIDDFVLIIGYMGDKIQEYIEENYDFKMTFVKQDKLLGLGYAVKLGLDVCENEPVLIALGDTIIEISLSKIFDSRRNTVGVHLVDNPKRFGVVELGGDRIIGLEEKPEHPKSNFAITGPYFFEDAHVLRDALEDLFRKGIRTRDEFQLTDAMKLMVENGESIYAIEIHGWFDCGDVETLILTNRHLLENVSSPKPQSSAVFIPPVYVGPNAKVESSIIGPNVSIGKGSVIRDAIIADSILGDNSEVSCGILRESILGNESAYHGRSRRMILGDYSYGGVYEKDH